MINGVRDFYILERFTDLIARHPDYPGKDVVVRECMTDIEQRYRLGEMPWDQKERLLAILSPHVEDRTLARHSA